MSERVKVLSIPIDNLSRDELIEKIEQFVVSKKPHQIITVNAEFLVAAQKDVVFREILRSSSLNTADGMGVLWAGKFLSLSVVKNRFLLRLQCLWQILYTCLAVVFSPSYIRTVIREKNSGSDLVWSISKLAAKKGYKLYLLGGFEDTPNLVAKNLLAANPSLIISGTHSGSPQEQGIVDKINQTNPDILMVAFGPVRQEKWLAENLKKLRISASIGLGGTFDYVAGKKPLAPVFLRNRGLEWAFRLFTQPYRVGRVLNAVPVFIYHVYRYKLLQQKPYRKNVVACLVDGGNQILICRKKVRDDYEYGNNEHWQLPQGGVEKNETMSEAAKREVFEETGIADATVVGRLERAHRYEWPASIAFNQYQGKYRGQEQDMLFMRVDMKKNSIKLDNEEFDAHRWVPRDKLLEALHPIRRNLGEIILENFDKYYKNE